MKMGPMGFPKKDGKELSFSLRNNPEECSFHLLRGRNLKSRKIEDISKNRWVNLSDKSIR